MRPTGEANAIHFLSAEELVDLFAVLQEAAKRDDNIPLKAGRDYLLPVEELEELCEAAAARDIPDAAATYLRAIFLMDLFPDGNFRMGLLAAELFLNENGLRLEYAAAHAQELRTRLVGLRERSYKKGANRNVTVLTEPYNELHEVARQFIDDHTKSAEGATRFPWSRSGR